uniref:HAP1 N-terminal domain-containing protein n=1 Tax=Nothoprocta perdicaria TaxID=30464 RepID=A0A8C6YTM2_NOTPE
KVLPRGLRLPAQGGPFPGMHLHSGGDVPEVEIVSLLGEPLPRYTLRADSVFGYEHDDWLRAPPLPPGAAAALTPRQLEETLRYFVLCAERVSRVTKTYHDIDAVTNLLEEKERDLELAARIGQSLLKQNRSLTERNELLEEQLELAKEEIAQLRHEVSMRDDLLHFYTTSTEESEPGSAASTPLRRSESSPSLQHYLQYDVLQQKLKGLEEENQKLRLEVRGGPTGCTEPLRRPPKELGQRYPGEAGGCTWPLSARPGHQHRHRDLPVRGAGAAADD